MLVGGVLVTLATTAPVIYVAKGDNVRTSIADVAYFTGAFSTNANAGHLQAFIGAKDGAGDYLERKGRGGSALEKTAT